MGQPSYLPGYGPSNAIRQPFQFWGGAGGSTPGLANNLLLRTRPAQGLGLAPQQPAPAYNYNSLYNHTPQASGKSTTMPYGDANTQTWNQMAGMAGVSRPTLDSALGKLAPGMAPTVAAYAQRYMGLGVPGDGTGVGSGSYGPATQAAPVQQAARPASSYGGTMNSIRQQLSGMPQMASILSRFR